MPGTGIEPRSSSGIPGGIGAEKRLLGQLEQEIGIGSGEVKDDRAGHVVCADPAGQIAAGGMPSARHGADDARELIGVGGEPEQTLDRAAEIAGSQRLPVGVANPGTKAERVARAAGGVDWQSEREIGDQPQSGGTPAALKRD